MTETLAYCAGCERWMPPSKMTDLDGKLHTTCNKCHLLKVWNTKLARKNLSVNIQKNLGPKITAQKAARQKHLNARAAKACAAWSFSPRGPGTSLETGTSRQQASADKSHGDGPRPCAGCE